MSDAARDLRRRANTYTADARAIRDIHLGDSPLSGEQWAEVFGEVARQLRDIAHDIDGRDR